MHYDPIKSVLGSFFNRAPWMRKLFYHLLDLLLLRSWHIRKALRQWQRSGISPAVNVLDAGFGFGQYAYYISGLNDQIRLTGIELKEEQVADCNAFFFRAGRKNATFITGDLTRYTAPETYDLILCVDVMEHILEDTTVFRNFALSMKTQGLLLISTPSDLGGSDVHDEHGTSFIEEHVRDGYNRDDITAKLLDAGFSRVEATYSYGKYGSLSWRISMKIPIQLVNASRLFFIFLPFYYLITFPVSLFLNGIDTHKHNPSGTGLIVKAWK